jgi:light-regulated signal transduction histidine kinase (bacteriophytochrome)
LRDHGSSTPYEKDYIRKDGSRVAVLVAPMLLEQPYSDKQEIVAFCMDLTPLKRVETELRQTNEALRQANVDLEQFAYSASHDLREPLRMVSIYSQLLHRRYANRLDERANEYIRFCVQGARRMQALIDDLLEYTRASQAYFEETHRTEASAALHVVLEKLSFELSNTGSVVTFDPLPPARVDNFHMELLLQNLISNAIKYRKSGQPARIHVSGQRRGDMCVYRVADQGIGIDPRFHNFIFLLFKRLHPADLYPGTGIGLALCKKIVTRYRGRIWVESEVGSGAAFYFTLPAVP